MSWNKHSIRKEHQRYIFTHRFNDDVLCACYAACADVKQHLVYFIMAIVIKISNSLVEVEADLLLKQSIFCHGCPKFKNVSYLYFEQCGQSGNRRQIYFRLWSSRNGSDTADPKWFRKYHVKCISTCFHPVKTVVSVMNHGVKEQQFSKPQWKEAFHLLFHTHPLLVMNHDSTQISYVQHFSNRNASLQKIKLHKYWNKTICNIANLKKVMQNT